MCGIAGILGLTPEAVSQGALDAMGATMQHRGPDNFGTLLEGRIGLAHNRLSIVDLSAAGNQPFRDGQWALVFNGEIYNQRVLRDDLRAHGVTVQGQSDTAALFAALIHLGIDRTLARIRGMFAFAFADLRTDTVWLVRDRFGIKPLFYRQDDKALYWASEVKALRPVTRVVPDPIRTLWAAASCGDHSNDRTVFEGVLQVEPGCYVVARPSKPLSLVRYYDVADEVDPKLYASYDRANEADIVATFDQLVRSSVQSMLMSDAPMGSFVSGGIDSSLISWCAVQHKPKLALFTANVVGPDSELEAALELARSLDAPLHEVRFEPQMFLEGLAKATWHYECPIVTHTNSVPFARVAQLARENEVKAVLTGEGSDELFMGYPQWAGQELKLLLRSPIAAVERLYGLVPGLKRYVLGSRGQQSITDFLELVVQDFERQRIRSQGIDRYGFLAPPEARKHWGTIQMLREGLQALLHRNDRMGMSASIEARFPFLDEEVVRFGVNLPLKWKLRRTLRFHDPKHPFLIDKWVVRRMAARRLPKALVDRQKKGFPLQSYRELRVTPGYFTKGYVAELVGLTAGGVEEMLRSGDPYLVAKLVAVDVFGRLYDRNESIEAVTDRLARFATLQLGDRTVSISRRQSA